MTSYEKYVFILCLIVFVCFTALFSTMIASLLKSTIKLIRSGVEDEALLKEYINAQKKKKRFAWIPKLFSLVICLLFIACFVTSMILSFTENSYTKGLSSFKVVKSESMATKYKDNLYLERDGLDDQLQMFDLIVTHELPDEMDLQLYDIVLYETEQGLVIHRIVNIEEPNDKHPNERHFRLRGDANKYSDTYPVRYSQMRAIYRGERVPFVGNIILFLQAPAGWLCILLILFGQIITPIVEKKLMREIEMRLKVIGAQTNTAINYSLQHIVISSFRFSLKLQRKDPLVDLRIRENRGGVKITVRKGSRKK